MFLQTLCPVFLFCNLSTPTFFTFKKAFYLKEARMLFYLKLPHLRKLSNLQMKKLLL